MNKQDDWRDQIITESVDLLFNIYNLLDNYADVNWDGDGPNRAMSLQQEIQELILKITANRKETK